MMIISAIGWNILTAESSVVRMAVKSSVPSYSSSSMMKINVLPLSSPVLNVSVWLVPTKSRPVGVAHEIYSRLFYSQNLPSSAVPGIVSIFTIISLSMLGFLLTTVRITKVLSSTTVYADGTNPTSTARVNKLFLKVCKEYVIQANTVSEQT